MSLDDKDLKILQILARNARVTYTEIGRKVGLSDVGVIKRVRRLENLGVIKGYTVVIDPRKLGYNLVSMTGIDVEPQKLFDVVNDLKKIENIKFIAITSGDHEIMTIIWSRDRDELAKIHDEISRKEGVKRVCPAIILDVVKDEKL